MEENETSGDIGMSYDYNLLAAQAVVDRERYFKACIRREANLITGK